MQSGQPRIGAVGLAVLVAASLGLHLGLGGIWRSERVSSLERELRETRREQVRTEARLSRQLRLSRAHALQLRHGLAQRVGMVTALRAELAEAQDRVAALETRATRASEALREEPPPLGVRIAAAGSSDLLLALADNPGQHDIRIVESQGRLWIGDRETPVADGAQELAIAPDEELDFFEFPLPQIRTDGEPVVRGVVCAVYERSLQGSAAAWAREIWFEYRSEQAGAAVVQQYRWAPWPDEAACDLSGVSPWWRTQLSAAR